VVENKPPINLSIDEAGADGVAYPRFHELGSEYPHHLEKKYERILKRIDEHWDTTEIDEVFADLIIDRRGGRQGFPTDVLNDIMRLKEFRESEKVRIDELRGYAEYQLRDKGFLVDEADFWRALNTGDQELIDLYVQAQFRFQKLKDAREASPLLAAVKRGYTITALILAKAGCDPDARDKLGLTPLLVCCGKPTVGYQTLAELLIKRGASVHVRDPLGNTPLLLAVSGEQWSICRLLLENGAKLSAINKQGVTPLAALQAAFEQSGDEQIKALLDYEPGNA